MTRILLVHQPIDGGVGRHVADLASGLAARGHEVVTCGPDPPGGSAIGWEHVRLDLRRAVSFRDGQMALKLHRLVLRIEPDLIHAHSSKAGAVARLIKLDRHRQPVLYTPHGFAFAGYFKSGLERHAYLQAERVLGRLTDRAICVCEAEARLARRVVAGDRVRVVYNGIEPAPEGGMDPLLRALADDGPTVCTLGLLRPGKGVETLIDAAPAVLDRHPRAQFAIWGDGPEAESLNSRAEALGVAHALHFLGPTATPVAAIRGADLFVMPSWNESFPYVVLEAMSAAVCVLATDVGGVREAITHGQDGWVVPAQNAPAMADAIVTLLDSHDRGRMAEAARQRVEREFTVQRMVDGHESVYAELVAGR